MTKAPKLTEKYKYATWQHKNATKNFDYTTIADRLRTVSWSNNSHWACVVKLDDGIPTSKHQTRLSEYMLPIVICRIC